MPDNSSPPSIPLTSLEPITEKPSSSVDELPETKPDTEEGDKWDGDEELEHKDESTVEPLGPIFITDPPTTQEPQSTAGKWPTESPTMESSVTETDIDNEA